LGLTAEAPRDSAPAETPADRLSRLLSDDMDRVEALIDERMQSPVGMIPDVADHLVGAGGKRLRPMIACAAARLLSYRGDGHLKLAAAVEFIHTATLLHDDVVDQSGLRRGKESANTIWGNSASVLVGDFLFARSFNLMVEAGSIEALNVLADAASVIAEGEVKQLAAIGDVELSAEAYLDIIASKTAELFAAAAESPSVLAATPHKRRQAMRQYGQSLGLAFQLVDDALDYAGATLAMGKSVGDDFREGKITMPVAVAYARGDAEERAFWARTLTDLEQTDGDFERALEIVARHNGVEKTLDAARHHANKAAGSLEIFEESPLRTAMMDLPDFVVSRVY